MQASKVRTARGGARSAPCPIPPSVPQALSGCNTSNTFSGAARKIPKSQKSQLSRDNFIQPIAYTHTLALKQPAFIKKEDMGGKTSNKAGYFDKLKGLLEEYKSVFIVEIDNVSSQQRHEIRASMRGQAVVLMGKNTMVSSIDPRWGAP